MTTTHMDNIQNMRQDKNFLNSEYQRAQNVITDRKNQGLDISAQQRYLNTINQINKANYGGTGLTSQHSNNNTQPSYQNNNKMNYQQHYSQPVIKKEGQLYGNANMNFNKWNDLNDVMSQLYKVGANLSGYSMNQNINGSQVSDLYSYFQSLHNRAKELGFQGEVQPGLMTGSHSDPNFVSSYDRGFGYMTNNPQYQSTQLNNNFNYYKTQELKKRNPYEQQFSPQIQQLREIMAANGLFNSYR
ncbi:hypothetical protein PZE06_05405 [Robertmurraya sp. DFI.2.37]|uniref:hypothetical protein n=1 Tax=Robertmurraya sp. DFI.2.37 TaxID=3031819 RepID=UPI0012479AAA|nr:hypothetical protein [Robertmurraya sp. DFI.2.37]MDF1507617.1 hypothetical protein [Robertmurraya sp. DFI.2.37]